MSKAYKSNNILVTMGDDFNYQDAPTWFNNLDKLIEYTNIKAGKDELNIKLFYSTPQCYLKAVKDANPTLPTKQDDFFPYASEPNNYWTGYYTSRPTTKYFERETNGYMQMAKQLQVLADLEKHNMFVLEEIQSAMGIMQHHDAITGTEKQHVAHDYERILNNAIEDSLIIPRQAFNKYMQGNETEQPIFSYDRCRLNESSCYTSENSENFVVTLYNHLAWRVKEPVRIPVKEGDYEVYAPNGDKIVSQLVDIPKSVRSIPTRNSNATHEVVFIAYLHPLSYKSFYIKKVQDVYGLNDAKPQRDEPIQYSDPIQYTDPTQYTDPISELYVDDLTMENQKIKIRMNPSLGQIFVATFDNETDLRFQIKYGYYETVYSGAYIFRPSKTKPEEIKQNLTEGPKGDVVKEIRIETNNSIAGSIRIYEELDFIEHDWVVGPINTTDKIGKEYIVRYATNILNNGEFYTDSNGRQMLKRKLFYRPQWNVSLAEPVAGNYYPIVNKISIKSDDVEVSVLTDRSEGGSSLEEGQIEVMLHRRLINDDNKGVGEALNETEFGKGLIVRGKHRMYVTGNETERVLEKKSVIQLDLQPQIFVSDAKDLTFENWLTLENCFSWANPLPDGLHLLTLEPWGENTILIRFENYLDGSDKELSDSSIEIDMQEIFKTLNLKSYKETTLAATHWLGDVKKWSWKTEDDTTSYIQDKSNVVQNNDFKIKLNPKEIRTFIVEYEEE